MKTLFKLIRFFFIRPGEWLAGLPLFTFFAWLNYLVVSKYADVFLHTEETSDFFTHFTVSGFDSLYYSVITKYHLAFFVYRHPLLTDMLWPLSVLNGWCLLLFGVNCATIIVALMLMLCMIYSFVFIRRTMREVVGLGIIDANLLSYLTFAIAYIMLTFIVPDHFAWSMALLTMTTYLAGKKMQTGEEFGKWQTAVLFIITAGVTMSNGVKTYIMTLFTNGRRFWRPGYLIIGVLLPAAAIWGYAYWQEQEFIVPREIKKAAEKKAKSRADYEAFARAYADTTHLTDSAQIANEIRKKYKQHLWDIHEQNKQYAWNANKGKTLSNEGFGAWTDISTPRWNSTVENLLGEGFQLHRDRLLEDALRTRPAFVEYRSWYNYAVETIIVLLFAGGVWMARRSRFLWMCLSCMAFDLLLHLGLGFGLNEVYIMTAHWAFIIPIAIGFLLHHTHGLRYLFLRTVALLLTLWLYLWNGWSLVGFLIG